MGNEGGGLNIETWTAQWHAEKKHKIMTNPLASLPLHHSQPAPHHRDHCCCCLHQLCRSCCHWYWCQIWNFLQHLPRSRQWSSRFHFHQRELWRFLLLGCTCNTRKWEHLGVRHNVGDVCVCGVCVCVSLRDNTNPFWLSKRLASCTHPVVFCVCVCQCVYLQLTHFRCWSKPYWTWQCHLCSEGQLKSTQHGKLQLFSKTISCKQRTIHKWTINKAKE